jgi:hypothetical protein
MAVVATVATPGQAALRGHPSQQRRRSIMRRRLFISDIHMGDTRSLESKITRYGWLNANEAARLGRFLTSSEARACDELFVIGDFLDLWITPIDVVPATPAEILSSPHNQPIVRGLEAWRAAGKALHYIPGNHDMNVTSEDLASLGFTFHAGPVVEGPFRISHGHDRCLFNGPDPTGRPRPFGYYISRFIATAAKRSPTKKEFNLWLVLRNPDDVLALATGGKRLGEAVYDVVVKEAAGLRRRRADPSSPTAARNSWSVTSGRCSRTSTRSGALPAEAPPPPP